MRGEGSDVERRTGKGKQAETVKMDKRGCDRKENSERD